MTACSPRSSMSSEPRPRGPAPSNVDLALEAVRDAIVDGRLRPLERDGLVALVPNRGAIVPELRAVDVLEVYALRASLGTLALHKVMLEDAAQVIRPLERELTRLVRAGERRRARDAADADLAYQQSIVTAAELPRVRAEFERLTWQVRMFLGAL